MFCRRIHTGWRLPRRAIVCLLRNYITARTQAPQSIDNSPSLLTQTSDNESRHRAAATQSEVHSYVRGMTTGVTRARPSFACQVQHTIVSTRTRAATVSFRTRAVRGTKNNVADAVCGASTVRRRRPHANFHVRAHYTEEC